MNQVKQLQRSMQSMTVGLRELIGGISDGVTQIASAAELCPLLRLLPINLTLGITQLCPLLRLLRSDWLLLGLAMWYQERLGILLSPTADFPLTPSYPVAPQPLGQHWWAVIPRPTPQAMRIP